jgi:predicted Fe-Mo cluster-binding NifX family protein
VLENPCPESGGGAGPLVAELMAKKGVTALVVGEFGMNIKAGLDKSAFAMGSSKDRLLKLLRIW